MAGIQNLERFHQLLLCFQCEKIPIDLLIRACLPRQTWSSAGEIVLRSPREGGVPEWLMDFYNANQPLFHDRELASLPGVVNRTLDSGVWYFKPTTEQTSESGFDPELEPSSPFSDRQTLLRECISVVLHAFPFRNTEIVGEEIAARLLHVATTFALPVFASLTDSDIDSWLVPREIGA
jgi:hypothetical protein